MRKMKPWICPTRLSRIVLHADRFRRFVEGFDDACNGYHADFDRITGETNLLTIVPAADVADPEIMPGDNDWWRIVSLLRATLPEEDPAAIDEAEGASTVVWAPRQPMLRVVLDSLRNKKSTRH